MAQSRSFDVSPGDENPLNAALTQRDRHVVEMVQEALQFDQTFLAYQPVMIARDSTRVGFYEGLIRITDETGRVIPARDFITAIETTETGRELDRKALDMGLQTLSENPGLRLSINMSARSIGYRPWMETLNKWVKFDSSICERLILEITESSAMQLHDVTIDFMDRLSRQGVCFAIDDFGAGYTSLGYLKDFFFDILKIDMRYCQGIASDRDNQALVEIMISISRHFDMLVVAEGVESKEDAHKLMELGVDCMQGYYFDAPSTGPIWTQAHAGQKRAAAPMA